MVSPHLRCKYKCAGSIHELTAALGRCSELAPIESIDGIVVVDVLSYGDRRLHLSCLGLLGTLAMLCSIAVVADVLAACENLEPMNDGKLEFEKNEPWHVRSTMAERSVTEQKLQCLAHHRSRV
jgi:hypothetical protein